MDSQEFSKDGLDIATLIKPYLKNWIWFVLSATIALVLGFLNIRYSMPKYAIQTKIQILDDNTSNSELAAFSELDIFGGGRRDIVDEMEILGSRTNFVEVVKKLGLNTKIIELGNLRNTEQYLTPSFNVNFIAPDSVIYSADTEFFITPKSETTFEYSLGEEEAIQKHSYGKNN